MQSLTQSLYFPHELQTNGGTIQSVTYSAEIKKGIVDLQDLPIQIWMGETEKDNLADGWVDPSTLTLVYDGTIDFPVGEYDVTVKLDKSYEYKGGNLVIYSFRKKVADGAYGNIENNFKSTTYPNSARSRGNFLVDDVEFDPKNPDGIDIVRSFDFIPNTNFVFEFSNMGQLSGKVGDGANSLVGVKILISGTNLYTLTNQAGEYSFPALRPGDYEIEVSSHGYFTEKYSITIAADATTSLNSTLRGIPTHTVSGKITASDSPDGLADAVVKISGYDNYTATTGADGTYSINGVYEGNTYTVSVEKALYDMSQSSIEIKETDVIFNVSGLETAYPVFSAQAVKDDSGIVVSWKAPMAGKSIDYVLDDDSPESGEGVLPGNDVRMGNMYETSDKGVLKSVMLLGLANNQTQVSEKKVTVEIYNSDRELIGTSDPFRIPEDAWVDVPLDNIQYSGTFYVMVRWDASDGNTNWIATDDNGPNSEKMWDMAYANGEWNSMYTLFRKRCVFMIRPTGFIIDDSVTPTPESYTVYRMKKGSEQDVSKWSEIGNVTGSTFNDSEYSMLADGSYRYAVAAVYSGENNVSDTVFTKSVTIGNGSVDDIAAGVTVGVFPNPVENMLNIKTDAEIKEVSITDIKGTVLKVQYGDEKQIDLSNLSPGYYIATIRTANDVVAVKITKVSK